jgi:type IV secretory pathway VirB10-like protein
MARRPEQAIRDRVIGLVRLASWLGAILAVVATWLFSNLALAFFSGQQAAPAPQPTPPVSEVPVQSPPAVIVKIVRHTTGPTRSGPGQAPRPPNHLPAAPPPPARPVCHSMPSKPC